MSLDDLLPVLTLLTSLIPAGIIFCLSEVRARTRVAVNLIAATLKLALIGVMLWGVFNSHRYEFRIPVLSGLDFVLRADALAMFFVTLSGVLWLLTTVYAIAYLEGSPHRSRFFGFFSLCVTATVGIALAGNLFTFVMFYELLTLSTYPLVVHRETNLSRRAGRTYLAYTLAGGAVLLLGAAWLHALVPTVDFEAGQALANMGPEHYTTLRWIFMMLVVGVGVKAALVPFHGWLPQAMVAPAPVSALLHAVAVVKAGAFGIVRIVYDVYGIELANQLKVTLPLAIWASATIIYGSIRALYQDDLKRRLAFSTVSQVSYVALGVALFGPSSTIGGVVHLVHQGLMKITLFFCAGILAETLGVKKISEMHGVGRRMPWTMTAFTIGALGMIGVPPVCGFISKWYLGIGAVEVSQYWVLAVLAISSALNAAYFLPILYVAWFSKPRTQWTAVPSGHRWETPLGLLLPPLITAGLAVGTGILAGVPFSPLQWSILIAKRAYTRVILDRDMGDGFEIASFNHLLLLLALAAPLLIVCLLLTRRCRGLALWCASLAALPAVALALVAQLDTRVDLLWFLLHMHLGVDATSQVFLLFTAVLWLLAGVYARGYLAGDPRARQFFFFFLLAMTGNFGLILSQDMASFYLFFALMSFASFPLVIHEGDAEALRAGRVYMILVVTGEVFLLAGMLLASSEQDSLLFRSGVMSLATSPLANWAYGLILMGFAIKAGLVPLHVWLPLAHPVAPTPASAVLSGAMIKAGLLGWLRYLPIGEIELPEWGNLCLVVGLVTAFYGVIVGTLQQNAKTILAYSSISQMGLMTLGVGGGMLVPEAWPAIGTAVLIYALHHGLVKGCLFLSVGIASRAGGRSWSARFLKLGLVAPALALAGAPLTIGAIGKSGLKYSLGPLPPHWNWTLDWLLSLASVGTTLLMVRFLIQIWPRSESATSPLKPTMLLSYVAILMTVLTAPWILPISVSEIPAMTLLATSVAWTNVWPVAFGAATAWAIWRIRSRTNLLHYAIPAGDILAVGQIIVARLVPQVRFLLARVNLVQFPVTEREREKLGGYFRVFLQSGESAMARWTWVAVSLIVLIGVCCFLWGNSS